MHTGTRGRLPAYIYPTDGEPTDDPPACIERVWQRRQRKIRALICRYLAEAAATPSLGLNRAQIRSRLAHHEPEEILHAIHQLEADGAIEQGIRTVTRPRRAAEPELYWRLTGGASNGSDD